MNYTTKETTSDAPRQPVTECKARPARSAVLLQKKGFDGCKTFCSLQRPAVGRQTLNAGLYLKVNVIFKKLLCNSSHVKNSLVNRLKSKIGQGFHLSPYFFYTIIQKFTKMKSADLSKIEAYQLSPIHIGPHGDVFIAVERLDANRQRSIYYRMVSGINRALKILETYSKTGKISW